jgi:hypothetical protein
MLSIYRRDPSLGNCIIVKFFSSFACGVGAPALVENRPCTNLDISSSGENSIRFIKNLLFSAPLSLH